MSDTQIAVVIASQAQDPIGVIAGQTTRENLPAGAGTPSTGFEMAWALAH